MRCFMDFQVAGTGDVVMMRMANNQLTFFVNDAPFADSIPNGGEILAYALAIDMRCIFAMLRSAQSFFLRWSLPSIV